MPYPVNIVRCVVVTCPTPPDLTHAIARHGSNYYGGRWNYRCEEGFHVGSGVTTFSISCSVAGLWWPTNKKCFSMECGQPPKIPKSKIMYYNKTVMEDDRISENAQYRCAKGRWISRGAYKAFTVNVSCVAGSWKPLPIRDVRCVLVTCDILEDPVIEEGNMKFNRSHLPEQPRYKATVTMECPAGQFFRPLKSRRFTAICQADGRWSVSAHGLKCEPTSCPLDIEDPNAVWSQPADTLIGSTAQVNCKPKFWLTEGIRSLTVTCGENGRWIPELKCLPVSCPDPTVEDATFDFVEGRSNHSDHYPVSSKIKFACNEGFEMWTDVGTLTCEVTGHWNPRHSTVTCQPIQCEMPPNKPANSEYLGANYFNSTLRMQCHKGFMISVGETYKSAKCLENSNWSEDISNYECVTLRCEHTGTIGNGSIVSASPPPLYMYQEVVRVSCLQGYWSSRYVRQFSSKCGDDADWEPRLDDVNCQRVSCIKPKQKSFSELYGQSLIAGSNLTLRCDPVHWILERTNESWYLQPKTALNFTCRESGEWNTNPMNIKCASTTTLSESQIERNTSLSLDKIEYVPSSEFRWLNNHIPYVISGPGDGSEVGHWIERLIIKGRRKSQRGLDELQEAMHQYPVYNRILSRILFEEPSNETLNRCLERYNSSEMLNAMEMYMDGEQNASVLFETVPPHCLNISLEHSTFNSSGNSTDMTILLARAADILNHTSVIDDIRNETVQGVRQSRIKARTRMKGRMVTKRSDLPILVSGKESALWDGDPLTAWKPSEHSITWKFEIHLGESYIVKDIILMTSSDVLANISFSVADGSLRKKIFGPYDLRSKKQKYFTSPVKVTIADASYDTIVTFSDFPIQRVELIEFSFDLPPVIREIGFLASPAKKIIVVYLEAFYHTLYAIIASFSCLILLMIVLDKHQNKNMAITWFGNETDGIPCIVQFQTIKKPRVSLDIYLHVLTNSSASHGSVVAWLRARPYTNLLNGRDIVGLYSYPPDTDKVNLRIACAILEEDRFGETTRKTNSADWVFDNVKVLCNGKKWVSAKSQFGLTPSTRLNIALQEKDEDKNQVIYCVGSLLKKHMLAFLYPFLSQNYQILRLGPKLVIVFFAMSMSMSIAVAVHELTDFTLSISGFPLNIQAFDGGYINMSRRSAAAILTGFVYGVITLFLLRFLFIYIAKVERRLRYSSKRTSAVLRIPGIYLYNLLMTGRTRISDDERSQAFRRYPFPSPSTLIRWLRERRRNQFKPLPEKSKSAPLRRDFIQHALQPSTGISCASKPVASTTDYSSSQNDSAGYTNSYDEEYSQRTVSMLFSDKMETDQSIVGEVPQPGEESVQSGVQLQPSHLSSANSSSATLKSSSYDSQASLKSSEYTFTGGSTSRNSLSDTKTISLTKSTSQSKQSPRKLSTASSINEKSSLSSGQTLIDTEAPSSSYSSSKTKNNSTTVTEINEKLKKSDSANSKGDSLQKIDPRVKSIRWTGPGKNLVDGNSVRVDIVSGDASKSPVMKIRGKLVMKKGKLVKYIDRSAKLQSKDAKIPEKQNFLEKSSTLGKELNQTSKDSLGSYSILGTSFSHDGEFSSSDKISSTGNRTIGSSILTSEPDFSKVKHSSSISTSGTITEGSPFTSDTEESGSSESTVTEKQSTTSVIGGSITDQESFSTSQSDVTELSSRTFGSSILTSEPDFSKAKHSSSISTGGTITEDSQFTIDTKESGSLESTNTETQSTTSVMGGSITDQEGFSTSQSDVTELSSKSQQRYSGLSGTLYFTCDGSTAGFSGTSLNNTGSSVISHASSSCASSSEDTSSSFDTSMPSDSTMTSSSKISSTPDTTSSELSSNSSSSKSLKSGRNDSAETIYYSFDNTNEKSVEVGSSYTNSSDYSSDYSSPSMSDETSSSTLLYTQLNYTISESSNESSNDTSTSLSSSEGTETESSRSTLTSGSSNESSDGTSTSLSSSDDTSTSLSSSEGTSTSLSSSDDTSTSLSSSEGTETESSSSTLTSGSSNGSSDDTSTSLSSSDDTSTSRSSSEGTETESSSSTLTSGSSSESSDDTSTSLSSSEGTETDSSSTSSETGQSSFTSQSTSIQSSLSYSRTSDEDSDSSSASSWGSTGTVKSWKPSSLLTRDTSSDYSKTADTSTRTTEPSATDYSELSHTYTTTSVDSTSEKTSTQLDSKISTHSGFSSDFRSVVESSSFSSADRDSSSSQSVDSQRRLLKDVDKPGISQSKTTDMSAISVATGRRTIYPHANAVHFLTEDQQLYIAPTSLLMIVVTLLAGIALSTCYFMVLNAEIDVKYVRDAAILSCALLISFGTFLEVLISSGIMHFAGIADEIDFEKEAPQLAKVEKLEPLCSDKKLNDGVTSGQFELDMEAGGDADSMTTLIENKNSKKRRKKGGLFSKAIQYSGDYAWQRERLKIMRRLAEGTKDEDTFSTRSCPRNLMFGRMNMFRDIGIQVGGDDISRKDFFMQLDLSLSNAARELAVLKSSSNLDDKSSVTKDVHRESVAGRGDEVRDFGKRTDDIHRNLVDQLTAGDSDKKMDEELKKWSDEDFRDKEATLSSTRLSQFDEDKTMQLPNIEEATLSSTRLSQFDEDKTKQLPNMEEDESKQISIVEGDVISIDSVIAGTGEDSSEIYWDAIDMKSFPVVKSSDITASSKSKTTVKDVKEKDRVISEHTTETSHATSRDFTHYFTSLIGDNSLATQAATTYSESDQYDVNFEFELDLDKFIPSTLGQRYVPKVDKSIQAILSREGAITVQDSSSAQSSSVRSKDSEDAGDSHRTSRSLSKLSSQSTISKQETNVQSSVTSASQQVGTPSEILSSSTPESTMSKSKIRTSDISQEDTPTTITSSSLEDSKKESSSHSKKSASRMSKSDSKDLNQMSASDISQEETTIGSNSQYSRTISELDSTKDITTSATASQTLPSTTDYSQTISGSQTTSGEIPTTVSAHSSVKGSSLTSYEYTDSVDQSESSHTLHESSSEDKIREPLKKIPFWKKMLDFVKFRPKSPSPGEDVQTESSRESTEESQLSMNEYSMTEDESSDRSPSDSKLQLHESSNSSIPSFPSSFETKSSSSSQTWYSAATGTSLKIKSETKKPKLDTSRSTATGKESTSSVSEEFETSSSDHASSSGQTWDSTITASSSEMKSETKKPKLDTSRSTTTGKESSSFVSDEFETSSSDHASSSRQTWDSTITASSSEMNSETKKSKLDTSRSTTTGKESSSFVSFEFETSSSDHASSSGQTWDSTATATSSEIKSETKKPKLDTSRSTTTGTYSTSRVSDEFETSSRDNVPSAKSSSSQTWYSAKTGTSLKMKTETKKPKLDTSWSTTTGTKSTSRVSDEFEISSSDHASSSGQTWESTPAATSSEMKLETEKPKLDISRSTTTGTKSTSRVSDVFEISSSDHASSSGQTWDSTATATLSEIKSKTEMPKLDTSRSTTTGKESTSRVSDEFETSSSDHVPSAKSSSSQTWYSAKTGTSLKMKTETKKPKLDTSWSTTTGTKSTSRVSDEFEISSSDHASSSGQTWESKTTATNEADFVNDVSFESHDHSLEHDSRQSQPQSFNKKHPAETEPSLSDSWSLTDKSASSVSKSESEITKKSSSMLSGKVLLCRVESITEMKPAVFNKSDQCGVVTCKIESKHKMITAERMDSGVARDMLRNKHSESLTDALAGVLVDQVLQEQQEETSTSSLLTAEDTRSTLDKKPSVTDDLAEIFVEKELDRIKHDFKIHQLGRDSSYDIPMGESISSENLSSVTSVSGDGSIDSQQTITHTPSVDSMSSTLPTTSVHRMETVEDFNPLQRRGNNVLCKVESVEFTSDKTQKIFLRRVRKQQVTSKPEQIPCVEQEKNADETSDSMFEDVENADEESARAGPSSKASLLVQRTSSSLESESESQTSFSDASLSSMNELRSIRQILADFRGTVAEEYERITNRPIQEAIIPSKAKEAVQAGTSSGIPRGNQSINDKQWNEQISGLKKKLEYAKQYAEFLKKRSDS